MRIDPADLGERRFLFISHRTPLNGDFSLSDLTGRGGRMDVIARAVTSALLTSNGIRRDASASVFFSDHAGGHKLVVVSGSSVRYLNPDERSAAGLLKGALERASTSASGTSGPGVYFHDMPLGEAINQLSSDCLVYYLREDGKRRGEMKLPGLFVLGDNMDLTQEEELELTSHSPLRISLSATSMHSDHCAVIINWLLDEVAAGTL